jgi:transcription initiation factor TFIIIB Brf1 subunit/transcription initiation factor TFIIB
MTDFNVFNFDNCKNEIDKIDNCECMHIDLINVGNITICVECGEEIIRECHFDKEWRYYGSSDSRHNTDPNRCNARKIEERGIYKDVELMGFNDKIINTANQLYMEVIQTDELYKIYRGNSRKAIIFACIFHSCNIHSASYKHDDLLAVFKISKKSALKGLKTVNRQSPKKSPVKTTYTTPNVLLNEIMDIFQATILQKNEVFELFQKINNKSSKLNRSRPKSVASGLTFYWIRKTNKNITLKEFTQKVDLSELTVNKIVKEIESILNK